MDQEEKREYYKKMYHENKVKVLERGKELIPCEVCSAIVHRYNLSNHKKSKSCLKAKMMQTDISKAKEHLKIFLQHEDKLSDDVINKFTNYLDGLEAYTQLISKNKEYVENLKTVVN